MSPFKEKIFTIVDVETTGASPVHDRVIEIGVLRIENGHITHTYNSLVNPRTVVSPFIERITGIKTEDLIGAPSFEDISNKISELLEGSVFVAHNARFDYGFIKNELKRSGISFSAKCLCTVRLSRTLFPEHKKHDLSSLIDRFNLSCENRHRAFDDAKVLWDFICHIKDSGKEEELDWAVNKILKGSSLPQFLENGGTSHLPERPGVYVFYGENKEILYIGKSKNIKTRVQSHFSNDHASTKEMHLCQQTVSVEGIETAGELSALLLESRMIKDLSPIYNRQLRRQSQLVIARKSQYGKYPSVSLERVSGIDPSEYRQVLGVFKNVSQAKTFLREAAKEFALCPKILGLEKGKGACFNHQINKCSGACVGKIDPDEYKKTFLNVFKYRKIRGWPFKGAILIEERIDDYSKHSFILDNWCLLADITTTSDDVISEHHVPRFDYDSYKIFNRYIRNSNNKKSIKNLNKKDLYDINKETENTEKYVYID